MADNVRIPVGVVSDPLFATDDVGGIHYPRIKISWGLPDSAVDASHTAPLPVVNRRSVALPLKSDGSGAISYSQAAVAATADSGNVLLAAPGSGLSLRVVSCFLNMTGAGTFVLKSGATTRATIISAGSGDGLVFAGDLEGYLFQAGVNEAITLDNQAGFDTYGCIVAAVVS